MAATEVVRAKVASLGMSMLQPAAGLAALERLLSSPALTSAGAGLLQQQSLATGSVDVVPFNWPRLLQRYQPPLTLLQDMADMQQGKVEGIGRQVQEQGVIQPRAAVAAAAAASDASTVQRLKALVTAAIQDVLGREVSCLSARHNRQLYQ